MSKSSLSRNTAAVSQRGPVRRRRLRGIMAAGQPLAGFPAGRQLTTRKIGDLLQEALRITEETTRQMRRPTHATTYPLTAEKQQER